MTSHLSSASAQALERVDTSTEQNITKCSPQELRFRGVSKCRRACCKTSKTVSKPIYIPFFTANRFCVMCKRKYYASGVQCMLGHFDCIPNPQ